MNRSTSKLASKGFPVLGVLFAFLFLPLGSLAAPLSLQEAVERALARSPHVEASQQVLEGAGPREGIAYLRTNQPVATFGSLLNQGRFTASLMDPTVDPSLPALNHPDSLDNFRTKFSVTQPLFVGGRLYHQHKISKQQTKASMRDLEDAGARVGFDTIKAYWGLSLARESLQVAGQAVATAEDSLHQIELLYKEGTVVRSDLLSAKVKLADFKEEQVKARGRAKLAERALEVLIGNSGQDPWEVAPLCPPEPGKMPDLNPENLLEIAQQKRPDYLGLAMGLDSARDGVKAAKGSFLTSRGVEASYEWNAPRIADGLEGSYMLGVGFNWGIFKGLEDLGRLNEAQSNEGRARAALKGSENRMILEIEEVTVSIETGKETIGVTRERVGLAEERLRIIRKRYQEGVTTVVELEQAELALSRSRLAWFQAIHDLHLALARLRLVTGELISSLPVLSCVPVVADSTGKPGGT